MHQSANSTSVLGLPTARRASAAKWFVLLSALCLALQVSVTDYGAGSERPATAVGWLLLGLALLWLVYRRRSRLARGTIVIVSIAGAVIYAAAAMDSGRSALLVALYLGQALPLLTVPVRRHVQALHTHD